MSAKIQEIKEIGESDAILAQFIGVDLYFDNEKYKDSKSVLRQFIHNRNKSEGLEFSYNWNWLMAVVDIINKRDWVTIYCDECKIHALVIGEFDDIITFDEVKPQIQIVYESCVKYADWYIQNNKKKFKM